MTEEIRILKESIANRDNEIMRLQVLTPSAGQIDSLKAGNDKKRSDDIIAQLKQQNELLRA